MINRENYEAFLIDLLEGTLSEVHEKELQKFLNENPELAPDNDLPDLSLLVEPETFPSKDDLKKGGLSSGITPGNFEQFCIARKEGDLDDEWNEKLRDFLLENPGLEVTASVYDKLTLQPEKSVLFPDKHKLRRKKGKLLPVNFKRSNVYRSLSVAASVAILISVSIFLINERNDEQPGFAVSQEKAGTSNPDRTTDQTPGRTRDISDIAGLNSEVTESITVKPVASILADSRKIAVSNVNRELPEVIKREPLFLPKAVKAGYSDVRVWSDIEQAETSIPVQLAMNHINRSQPQSRKLTTDGLIAGVITFISRNIDNETDRDRLNIWDLADAGFKGINFIAGTELSLDREYDENGELVSTEFSSPIFGFQRTTTINEE